jgi:hypothetical protein
MQSGQICDAAPWLSHSNPACACITATSTCWHVRHVEAISGDTAVRSEPHRSVATVAFPGRIVSAFVAVQADVCDILRAAQMES